MTLDLDETETLIRLLRDAIDGDRYFLSQRVQTLQTILSKLRPKPPRAPLPPLRIDVPPARGRGPRRG